MKKQHLFSLVVVVCSFLFITCDDSTSGNDASDFENLTKYTWESTKIVKSGQEYPDIYVYTYNFNEDGTYRAKLSVGANYNTSDGEYMFDEEYRTLELDVSPTYTITELSSKKLVLESSSELYEFRALSREDF